MKTQNNTCDLFKSFEFIPKSESFKQFSRNNNRPPNSFNPYESPGTLNLQLVSHEEIIFDMINEIPHYFDTDEKASDDLKLFNSRRASIKLLKDKHDHSSKSVDKKKEIQGEIRRKSILYEDNPMKICPQIDNKKIKNDAMKNYEVNLEWEEAWYLSLDGPFPGIASVSDYRFRFVFYEEKISDKLRLSEEYFSVPLFAIAKIDKSNDKKENGKYIMDIQTKDFRNLKFKISNEDMKLYWILQKLAFPSSDNQFYLFAFKYCGNFPKASAINGWNIYDIKKEFDRQELDYKGDKSKYRLSNGNQNFKICSSYPKYCMVPRFFSDEEIWECCNFRTKNRFPVLSWQYPVNKCCLWRSSQSKGGIIQQRSSSDEKLLRMMCDFSDKLIIYDARPYLNAFVNKFKGAGFENVENYQKCELKFCDIDNIHAMRNSMMKLYALIGTDKQKENKKFLSMLEQTGWLDFISNILKSSLDIASSIKSGCTVLVHCSDGWDRTTQLSASAQLLLDPYYRTLEGFIILIEKEWLSFGHQFPYRSGLYTQQFSEDQRSPIFLQWLDCAHQLLFQFPHAFEFNNDFLVFIASHLYTCKYGTFLFKCEKDRDELDAKNRTMSIWTEVLSGNNRAKFLNPFYLKELSVELIPNYGINKLRLWEEYFFQYELNENAFKLKCNSTDEEITVKSSTNFYEAVRKDDIACIHSINENLNNLKNTARELFQIIDRHHLVGKLSMKTLECIRSMNILKNEAYEIIPKVKAECECECECESESAFFETSIKETMHIDENYIRK